MKKIFYGWYIVAAALTISVYNSTTFSYGWTAFVTPITVTYGWTYAQVSLATSIRGFEVGTLDPFLGMAADRWPARRLMLIGICLIALGIYCISQSTSLAMFYTGFLVVGLGSATGVTMVPQVVIARWFSSNLGKASGILVTARAVGGLLTPLLVVFIDSYGWQVVLACVSIGMLVLGIPLSLVFRDRPEKYGFLPDGKAPGEVRVDATDVEGATVREALRMRAFWYIGVAHMLQMTVVGSIIVHQMPYLTSIGLERSTAAVAITIFSVVSIGSRLVSGFLADIFRRKYVLALAMALMVVGVVILGAADGSSFILVVLYAVIYGIGIGGTAPLQLPIAREYFGIRKFGTIYGLIALFTMFGSIIGAPLTGWVYDTYGHYGSIWFVYAGLVLVGGLLILMLPRPAFGKSSPIVE